MGIRARGVPGLAATAMVLAPTAIVASVGKGVGVITDAMLSAIVIVVVVTALVIPPARRWSLWRRA